MKKNLLRIGIFGVLLLLLIGVIIFQNSLSPNLKINEVSFQNNSGEDWIEIYNPSLNAKNLKGFYLTDDKMDKTKFQIKNDIIINPKSFLVIGGKNADKTIFSFITNFGLKNGETLFLIDTNGVEIVDSFPLVLDDENLIKTVGRFPDGAGDIFSFSVITKGKNNIKDLVIKQ